MLNSALSYDQIAKNAATFGYQCGYQLADGTGQKVKSFSPVHSVRDRGVGGSNPLAPTNLLRKQAELSLVDHSVSPEWSVPQIALCVSLQAQKNILWRGIVRLLLG